MIDLQRGGVLIKKWGRSSAASTSVSIVDAIRSLVTPTPEGDWFSSGVSSILHICFCTQTLQVICTTTQFKSYHNRCLRNRN